MKTVHEFLVSKGIKSMGEQIPTLVVEQYIKEYCSDLLVFCAENAELTYNEWLDCEEAIYTDRQSILKIQNLI